MAFLMAEYRMLAIFIVVVAALLFVGGEDNGLGIPWSLSSSVLFGSAAGFSGMQSATIANGRTAQAAANGGQAAALTTSYNGGAVMGLAVGGLGLLGISLMYYMAPLQKMDSFLLRTSLDSEWVLLPSHYSLVLVEEFTPRLRM